MAAPASPPRPVAALTGATGFLGAHLARALDAAGFAVRVLPRNPNVELRLEPGLIRWG